VELGRLLATDASRFAGIGGALRYFRGKSQAGRSQLGGSGEVESLWENSFLKVEVEANWNFQLQSGEKIKPMAQARDCVDPDDEFSA
jgi:hypothetical protein